MKQSTLSSLGGLNFLQISNQQLEKFLKLCQDRIIEHVDFKDKVDEQTYSGASLRKISCKGNFAKRNLD